MTYTCQSSLILTPLVIRRPCDCEIGASYFSCVRIVMIASTGGGWGGAEHHMAAQEVPPVERLAARATRLAEESQRLSETYTWNSATSAPLDSLLEDIYGKLQPTAEQRQERLHLIEKLTDQIRSLAMCKGQIRRHLALPRPTRPSPDPALTRFDPLHRYQR